MYYLKHIFVVVIVVTGSVSAQNEQLLKDLPSDIVSNILSIVIHGTVQLIGNCTNSINEAPETNYWIYTNNNPNDPSKITTPSKSMCHRKGKIIFLAHGWSSDANAVYIIGLKDAYLKKYKRACIISVNWGNYALQNYQSAYCAAPEVASNVAAFICNLLSTLNVDPKKLHLVGHSMGAHIFGIAGSLVKVKCASTIGRITGLDPAGPLYNGIAKNDRLDPTDATFVDVIHTNQGQFGYLGNCGHLDAFANCGYLQPGCLNKVINGTLQNPQTLLDLPVNLISCNHRRSCDYFQESIPSNKFIGRECIGCPLPTCAPSLLGKQVIGESDTSPGSAQDYVFYTNSQSPYAKG